MYCRVFACDFDGTGASNGHLAPEIVGVLAAARAAGYVTMLVTGRVLEDLQAANVDFTTFDAVVAENGAIVWLPSAKRTIQLGTPPPDEFLAELRAMNVSFHAGTVLVGTWDRHVGEVLDLIRRLGLASQIVFNRAAMMVLPSAVDKAVGIRRALAELQRSVHNTIAFGDAENDRPLLDAAEVGIAARGSVASIAAMADEKLSLPGAAGVAHRIQAVLDRGGHVPTPARQRIVLGSDDHDDPVFLPADGTNLMISGDPRSGKSWLAGLVVERLLDRDYRLCVFDPEGDYVAIGRRIGVLALGADIPLPAPEALGNVLRDDPLSLVLNLAALSHAEKLAYVARALPCLAAARQVTGVPQWIVLDEAHYFLNEKTAAAHGLEDATGSYVLERDSGCTWRTFRPASRDVVQAHHGRKYADTLLPPDKAFRFLQTNGTAVPSARSVAEFCAAVRAVPLASLRHHLLAGDFSRWAADVLGDGQLAASFRKLEDTTRVGAPPSRDELLAHAGTLYLL